MEQYDNKDVFDASEYLKHNPDVAKAIDGGHFRSAWSHFVAYGFREKRNGVPEAFRRKVNAVMSVFVSPPPAKLAARVHGSSDIAGFESVGKTIALDIYGAINSHLDLESPLRILDFGCGCGRILPYMTELDHFATFYASDIDSEAIQWCKKSYSDQVEAGHYHFAVNSDVPPIAFPSGFFDLVYAISVFTHLPEDLELLWLRELARITKPGGILLLSTAGEALIRKHLTPNQNRILDEKGFYYFPFGNTDALPDYYQASWHTSSYIDKIWSQYFNVLRQIPAGINNHQDLILGRRPQVGH